MTQEKIDHIGDTNKMVTAVDTIIKYCEEKLHTSVNSHGGAYTNIINFCKQQAKEMEKEQMKDCMSAAFLDGLRSGDENYKAPYEDWEQYYNETYKGK